MRAHKNTPDIDVNELESAKTLHYYFPSVEAHFASVENHILSDIHNYHMAGQQMRQTDRAEEPEDVAEDNWEEEHMDQYVISRFTPERASWRSEVDVDEPDDRTEYWLVPGVQTVDSCAYIVLQVGQAR